MKFVMKTSSRKVEGIIHNVRKLDIEETPSHSSIIIHDAVHLHLRLKVRPTKPSQLLTEGGSSAMSLILVGDISLFSIMFELGCVAVRCIELCQIQM